MPKDGKRAIVRCRDDDHIHPFPLLNLKGCRALHVDGHQPDAAIHYAKLCREDGILTSLDGGGLRTNTHELLEFIDVAIVAERLCEQMDLTPEKMLDYLKSRGCRVGGVTQGEKGLLWFDEAGVVHSLPALPISRDRVLDTNGAGDVFHGAYVHSYLSNPGKSWHDHFGFARAASTYKFSASATRRGCRRLPTSKPSGRNLKFTLNQPILRFRKDIMGGVFVAGSINMDVVATANRHPKIGETVAGSSVLYFPGGKGANQAVAAAELGAPTTLIGRLGADAFGRELENLSCRARHRAEIRARRRRRIPALRSSRWPMPTTPSSSSPAPTGWSGRPTSPRCRWPRTTSPSASSRFPQAAIKAFFSRARAAKATTILNPAPMVAFNRELLDLVDILILNETELGVLTNTELSDSDDLDQFIDAAQSLRIGADRVICVTLGKRGVMALVNGVPLVVPGRAVKAIDTTGAGDCFVGAVAAQLAGGNSVQAALHYANAAASVCVQRMGAAPSMPTVDEVKAALVGVAAPPRVVRRTPGSIRRVVSFWQRGGRLRKS